MKMYKIKNNLTIFIISFSKVLSLKKLSFLRLDFCDFNHFLPQITISDQKYLKVLILFLSQLNEIEI